LTCCGYVTKCAQFPQETRCARRLRGAATGLQAPAGIALNSSDELIVANVKSNSITVYAAGAKGNAPPLATITGPATGILKPAGIAVDTSGVIYVPNLGSNTIVTYAKGAKGNAVPVTTVAGSLTQLVTPLAIAIHQRVCTDREYVAGCRSCRSAAYYQVLP
jgi:hypothetical protein